MILITGTKVHIVCFDLEDAGQQVSMLDIDDLPVSIVVRPEND